MEILGEIGQGFGGITFLWATLRPHRLYYITGMSIFASIYAFILRLAMVNKLSYAMSNCHEYASGGLPPKYLA